MRHTSTHTRRTDHTVIVSEGELIELINEKRAADGLPEIPADAAWSYQYEDDGERSHVLTWTVKEGGP